MRAKCADPLAHTTYDLVQMAPWSADTLRRLKREEKREEAKAKEAADAIVMAEVQELKDRSLSMRVSSIGLHEHGTVGAKEWSSICIDCLQCVLVSVEIFFVQQ